jgi:hypothetical protein
MLCCASPWVPAPTQMSWKWKTLGESLYDWADFAYRYEVWSMNLPEEATVDERSDMDAWLGYLDRLAVKHGKRRPRPSATIAPARCAVDG